MAKILLFRSKPPVRRMNSTSEYREAIPAEMRQNPSVLNKLTFFGR